MARTVLSIFGALSSATAECVANANATGFDFFEAKVRPVLAERCYECHSAESKKVKGGLLLDTHEGLLKGGESGKPAVVPGQPDQSRLIEAIHYDNDDLQMPPKKKLSDAQVADLVAWVAMGAPDPRTNAAANARPAGSEQPHWAFLPPKPQPRPAVRNSAWVRTDIDRFILAKLEANGLVPAPRADKRTLIRRATFDLHGLAPAPEDVAAFEHDESSDAFDKVVDRLLASPRYGERWGRHWLDVARYADTKGYVYSDREDPRYVHSYPYRDWVIRALNEDMPYDLFLKLQVAADQMVGPDAQSIRSNGAGEGRRYQPTRADLAAMGFLTLGRRFLGVTHDIIDDRIDVLTRGMQGLTVACARCHDHKYDPIPTRDYYSLYGVFDATTERFVSLAISTNRTPAERAFEKELTARVEKFQVAYQKAREEVAERLRKRTTDYLVAQLTVKQLPNEEFYEILDADQVNPIFVRRWQAYLQETSKQFHPVFAPWHTFAALPEKGFEMRAPVAWAKFTAEAGTKLNPIVREAFDAATPRSMKEVAEQYGRLLESVRQAESTNTPPADDVARAARDALRSALHAPDAPVYPPMGSLTDTQFYFDEGTRVNLGKLWKAIEEWHITAEGAVPHAGILEDRAPRPARVFKRGNPGNRGDEVPRQYLEVVAGAKRKAFENGSGRLEMAALIASCDNPLTARVMVNRVWLHHFGAGLVKTSSDFGTRCEPPSHPELLDHLALWFMEHGWSLKELHRLIMLSATYQQSSGEVRSSEFGVGNSAHMLDPENRLLWRMNRQRRDFEGLRDSLLAASGELDLAMGGKPVNLFERPFTKRRTVYGYIDRQFLPGTLRAFDFANPDLHIPQRHQTTVPQQALYLMNSTFVVERAQAFAARVATLPAENRVRAMYRHAFQREPSFGEMEQALVFVKAAEQEPQSPPPPPKPSPWHYGYGTLDPGAGKLGSFTPFPRFEKGSWQGGKAWPDAMLGWLRLTAAGGHPGEGAGRAVVRRWVAPLDCALKVSGKLAHESKEGDGIRATLVHSGRGQLASWSLHNQKAETVLEIVELKRGEWLDFIVDCRSSLSHDDFKWAPVVALVDAREKARAAGEPFEWNARKDFAGPPPEPPMPLDAWSALAQALLISNEFLFVD